MHILSDANGLPLVVGTSHGSEGLKPMIAGLHTQHDPHRGRYFKPQRLHAYKAYDVLHLRRWLWGRHIGVRVTRKGIQSSDRLGRHRWVIERTLSWLTRYRHLSPRYERHPLPLPGLPRPRSRPVLLQTATPPHHIDNV
ncbi:hypothetical protein GCM10010245_88780 [Streptomyces spectabilis]|nr:hypothetical protein GCM10010245_88780 [Streptomyces spectabilis]